MTNKDVLCDAAIDTRHKCDLLRDMGLSVVVSDSGSQVANSADVERTFYEYESFSPAAIVSVRQESGWGTTLSDYTDKDGLKNDYFVARYKAVIYSYDPGDADAEVKRRGFPENAYHSVVLASTHNGIMYVKLMLSLQSPLDQKDTSGAIERVPEIPIIGEGVDLARFEYQTCRTLSRHEGRKISRI